MCELMLNDITGKMLADDPQPQSYMFDYPASKPEWSEAKTNKYETNLASAFYDPKFKDYL